MALNTQSPPIPMSIKFTLKGTSKLIEEIISGANMAFIIRFECNDSVTKESIIRPIWCKINLNEDELLIMTNEEKSQLKPYYLEIVQEHLINLYKNHSM